MERATVGPMRRGIAIATVCLLAGLVACSEQADFTASIEHFEVAADLPNEPGRPSRDRIDITSTFTNHSTQSDRYIRCEITLSESPSYTDDDEIETRAVVPAGGSTTETQEIRIEMDAKQVNHIEVNECLGVGGQVVPTGWTVALSERTKWPS